MLARVHSFAGPSPSRDYWRHYDSYYKNAGSGWAGGDPDRERAAVRGTAEVGVPPLPPGGWYGQVAFFQRFAVLTPCKNKNLNWLLQK